MKFSSHRYSFRLPPCAAFNRPSGRGRTTHKSNLPDNMSDSSAFINRFAQQVGNRHAWLMPLWFVVGSFAPALLSNAAEPDQNISFRNDVMAVLSKAGCNMGVCHGNKNGKAGFKLSLRGQNPAFDYEILSRDLSGRRTNPMDPERSLILLKPTMQVPHEGGRRFDVDSKEYRILRRWIAAGLPTDGADTPHVKQLSVTPTERIAFDPVEDFPIQVEATFSDGKTIDVTDLAVYETSNQLISVSNDGVVSRNNMGESTFTVRFLEQQVPVRVAFLPARPDFQWRGPEPANFIDEQIFAKLEKLRINPSEVCDGVVFMRRAYLDLLGILPTADESRAFIADTNSNKRSELIDRLLDRPEFADFWAQKWSDLLRNEEKTLDRKGVQNFYSWIRLGIAKNKPLDQFVQELIASRGSTYAFPEANYYRAMRDPLMRAESTAQLFLGIRLQCAKCHNHPFDVWTQDDYYGWANLFSRVEYEVLENRRRDRNDNHEFAGEQVVYMLPKGEVEHPSTGKPVHPRLLGAEGTEVSDEADRLFQLAEWIAGPDNPRFAESQVNRIWFNLMGRGIVDPIDDFRSTNPATHPQLLESLAADFVNHGFDRRQLIRTIMNSKAYQLSSIPNESNAVDTDNYSHALPRRLTAEQLCDAISQAAGTPIAFNGYPLGIRAGEIPGVRAVRFRDESPSSGDQFLTLFGKPPRLESCECERSDESTLSQAFQLISGPFVNELLTAEDNRIEQLLDAEKTHAEIVDELYWTCLSRPPSQRELEGMVAHLAAAGSSAAAQASEITSASAAQRRALEDIVWGLLNSNEFVLRR